MIASPGQFGGVAGPVACGVSGPSGGGSGGQVQEFGQHGCGDLSGELMQGGASPWEGLDAEHPEAFAEMGRRDGTAGQVPGEQSWAGRCR